MGFQRVNKRGLQLKSAMFAAVIVSTIIISVGVIIGEWGLEYDSGINYDLSEYDNLHELSQEAQDEKTKITPQDPDPGSGDFEGKLFRGGYGIIGRIFLPFRSIFNMLESVENRWGLPSYVTETILTLMYLALIYSAIAIIFRLPQRSA
jgi:hypothetical protein